MKVVLGIPWRPSSDRVEILERIEDKIRSAYPYDEVFFEDSGHQNFNRAATRNKIVVKALEMDADVVVIGDADSIPEPEPLKKAIDRAYSTPFLVIPFDEVHVINQSMLVKRRGKLHRCTPIRVYGPSCGGVYVTAPQTWFGFGGMDERIQGWGYEDECLIVASRTLGDGYECLPGKLYTINHERPDQRGEHVAENKKLRDLYNDHIFDKDYIYALQRGSNDFCPIEGEIEEDYRLYR